MIKYRLEFYGRTDKHHKVEINIPSYEGDVIPLTGVEGSALQLNWNGDENIFDAHVIGSQLVMSVYDENNIDLDELMLTPDLEYQVNYYIDDSLFWRGYLISDGVQESLIIGGEVKLTAVDGMNAMEGIDYDFFKNNLPIQMPEYYTSPKCPLNIIRNCFAIVGNVLPINFMLSTTQSDRNALAGVVEWGVYNEWVLAKKFDTFEVFENILKSFNLHAIQYDGEWWLFNTQDLRVNSGVFNGYRLVEQIATTRTQDFNVTLQDINSSGVRMVNKPISKVVVRYENTTEENILPNGSLNAVTALEPLYWRAENGTFYTYESINGRTTDSYDRTEFGAEFVATTPINFITLDDGQGRDCIMMDSKILFQRFNIGFTVKPVNYPTKLEDGQNLIDWLGAKPLKMELSFMAMRDGVMYRWVLNENGYWVRDTYDNMRIVSVTKINEDDDVHIKITGAGVVGQEIRVWQWYEDAWGIERQDSYMPILTTQLTTEATIDHLVATYPSYVEKVDNETLLFYGIPRQTQDTQVFLYNGSGVTTSNYVSFIVDNAMNEDIIKIQFTSKGGESRIKFPEISELSNNGEGELRLRIKHSGVYTAVFDDIYMNVDQNNDQYTAELPAKKASKEEHTLKISSSYSGFLLSSYMNSFANSHECMYFNRFGINATLTEHYARDVIRVKSEPYQKIDNEYQGLISPIYSFNTLMALGNCSYNAHNETTQTTMIEVKLNELDPTIKHNGTNDENINS